MLRKRAFGQLVASEQAPDALGVHDERTNAVGRLRGWPIIGHIDADPLVAIPLDNGLLRVPGFSSKIGARAIVEDSPICRPSPCLVRGDALFTRVGRITASHLVALL